jgi:hypothetical protein
VEGIYRELECCRMAGGCLTDWAVMATMEEMQKSPQAPRTLHMSARLLAIYDPPRLNVDATHIHFRPYRSEKMEMIGPVTIDGMPCYDHIASLSRRKRKFFVDC